MDNNSDILLDSSCDPDENFFNVNTQNLNTLCLPLEKFQNLVNDSSLANFSCLHLNIRSMKQNFENFKLILWSLNFSFSVICFSETWFDISDIVANSLYGLPYHIGKQHVRGDRKERGVFIYVHKSLNFKVRNSLGIDCKDVESLLSDKKQNILVIVLYRPQMVK